MTPKKLKRRNKRLISEAYEQWSRSCGRSVSELQERYKAEIERLTDDLGRHRVRVHPRRVNA